MKSSERLVLGFALFVLGITTDFFWLGLFMSLLGVWIIPFERIERALDGDTEEQE